MTEFNNFQRVGSVSNAHAGSDFERIAAEFFRVKGISLQLSFAAVVGAGSYSKTHRFDLGADDPPILVECKSHTWTQGGNVPSAKITVWNEAMYYFHIAPSKYRKVFFVLKSSRRDVSLATYYLANYRHMVPMGVEFWEYCTRENVGAQLL